MSEEKKEKKISAKKEKKEVTPFFSSMVGVYKRFVEGEFGEEPTFDGSAPRDLKMILDAMRKKSDARGLEWTIELSTAMLQKFLEFAAREKWLRDNFFLFNLNRQKDKIFLKIKSELNGTSKTGFTRDGLEAEFNRRYSGGGQVQFGEGGQNGNQP